MTVLSVCLSVTAMTWHNAAINLARDAGGQYKRTWSRRQLRT